MFASIEEEFRRGSPIESWHRVYKTYESVISATLAEAVERWPTVLVGSYPSFGNGGFDRRGRAQVERRRGPRSRIRLARSPRSKRAADGR